jgi:hypothetical protein
MDVEVPAAEEAVGQPGDPERGARYGAGGGAARRGVREAGGAAGGFRAAAPLGDRGAVSVLDVREQSQRRRSTSRDLP